jgi:hypothetical protein
MFRVRGEAAAGAERVKGADPRQLVDSKVLPTVKETALNAATAALELWQAATHKADTVVESVSETAHHVVADPAHQMVAKVGQVAHDTTGAVASKAEAVTTQAREAGERTKMATKHAAEATVSTGKDSVASLLWVSAAAGVVLYLFMDRERRDQVLGIAKSTYNQFVEIIQDYQGYDGQFEQ